MSTKDTSISMEHQLPSNNHDLQTKKLEGKLKKQLRQTCLKFKMIEDGDHIMCCVSGGKDSATMLYLLCALQKQLRSAGRTNFKITAVHLNQMQPGYNGEPLVKWLEELVDQNILDGYRIITEDTYSVVIDKTPENKVYCSMCSRLRRGILYTVAHEIHANKIALGHHGDDAIQTLLLNFIHAGQMKAMPARYFSTERNIHVIRPLMGSLEHDIASYASAKKFPILPCNLCGTQPDAQRAKVRMLLDAVEALSPDAKKNMMNAMGDIRPSHLLDIGLREACGMDGATGMVVDPKRASLVKGYQESVPQDDDERSDFLSQSRIERLL
jgi:tRNA 2-thiocytidine biosynthesis protein TtcA